MSAPFDFKNPDFTAEFRRRADALARIRRNPEKLPALKEYYRDHVADFITDWGCTYDPRLVARGLPAIIPFVLFPKQRNWVTWLIELWRAREPGLTEKSRDCGITWLAVGTCCTLSLFYEGFSAGFGSRKQEYVDILGDPKSILEKGRWFLKLLPLEFRGGWDARFHGPHMRLFFPETGASITGEAGDNIGRGDRKSIYLVDEAAHIERPQLVDAALSATTDCRVDVSTPKGMGNSFAVKRHGGKIKVFICDWRDDPRKDEDWYEHQKIILDPVVLAQEVDRDYMASVEGVVIPGRWLQACVDAHVKLGLEPSGDRFAAWDVGDGGRDPNAFVGAYGFLVEVVEEWSGFGADSHANTVKAYELCDEHGYARLRYDGDGIGSMTRGPARILNERRVELRRQVIEMGMYRGSDAVQDPNKEDVKGRKNKDYFLNRKSQAWWRMRLRCEKTYLAVVHGHVPDPDEILSIPSTLPLWQKLITELSQPTYTENGVGKLVIDKAPDGEKSPNLADSLVMRYARGRRGVKVSRGAVEAAVSPAGRVQALQALEQAAAPHRASMRINRLALEAALSGSRR